MRAIPPAKMMSDIRSGRHMPSMVTPVRLKNFRPTTNKTWVGSTKMLLARLKQRERSPTQSSPALGLHSRRLLHWPEPAPKEWLLLKPALAQREVRLLAAVGAAISSVGLTHRLKAHTREFDRTVMVSQTTRHTTTQIQEKAFGWMSLEVPTMASRRPTRRTRDAT